MRFTAVPFVALGALALAGCGDTPYDPRGVDHEETLLSVSATGEAETRPDQARFQAGVNNWAASARAASEANARQIREIVAALQLALGSQDEAENIAAVSVLVEEAAAKGAQVVAPPELFSGPYFCKIEDDALFALARPTAEHPSVVAMQKLAKALKVAIPTSFFEKDVIVLFDAYGFELVGKSEVNANPKDPANWETGVWTLPPAYRGAGEDAARRAELDAIGESDRMTLLFRKRP